MTKITNKPLKNKYLGILARSLLDPVMRDLGQIIELTLNLGLECMNMVNRLDLPTSSWSMLSAKEDKTFGNSLPASRRS
jgi:hypothetical protein